VELLVSGVGALVLGLVLGFFISRKVFQVQLKKRIHQYQKKQVRAMLSANWA